MARNGSFTDSRRVRALSGADSMRASTVSNVPVICFGAHDTMVSIAIIRYFLILCCFECTGVKAALL